MPAFVEIVWTPEWLNAALLEAHAVAVDTGGAVARSLATWRHVRDSVGTVALGGEGGITVGAGDWRRLEFGTRPHPEKPVKARAMKQKGTGTFSASANHPGQRAVPFLRPIPPMFPGMYAAAARARLPGA